MFIFKKAKQGFTLIELLIIIAVLAVLVTIVFVALDPLTRFQDSRNARRRTDVEAILSAIKYYQVDHGGSYLSDITDLTADNAYQIGTSGTGCDTTCANPTVDMQAACVDLSDLVSDGKLPSIPYDPNAEGASASFSHYYLIKNTNNSITVGSCDEEIGSADAIPQISASR